ncbi:hypothetical protein F7725_006163 [Dissostichus mawsoni]|uniref:Alpha-2-macroglobulin domain-containing protein n=1 Tax=Dissostichus mawsoni TaxID=36200 RepID=A0A7J5YXF8_DISMA|nr:hypothetical protein F7725_006163 [Dissostichus mawsoni]
MVLNSREIQPFSHAIGSQPFLQQRPRPDVHSFSLGITASKTVIEKEVEADEEEEWEYLDETQVSLRSRFYESWLWTDVDLPTQADRDGFLCSQALQRQAWKRFFVDLKLPYSVARNEQVEIKAVVHNYGYDELHDRHTQEVTLAAGASVALPYTIVPLVVGKLPLEVMVVARDAMGGDRIQKLLNVVMDGVQKTEVWSAVLNPSAEGGTQTVIVARVNLDSVVPNSVPETFINVRGNVLADSIDNSISEDSLASLIRMPGGCVEQNLASITLPLIATLYLDTTDSWESVGVQRKAEALRYIRRGYENQLAYRKSDGSYPPYRREGATYVVKVFSMAHSIVGINEQQVCEPLLYLVNNKHKMSRWNFVEDNPVYSTTMTGGLRGDDPETTLTAFVLIALAEAKHAGISCVSPSVKVVIRKTAEYLKRALVKTGRRPYTVAIASYALALLGKDQNYNPTQSLLSAAAPGDRLRPAGSGQVGTHGGSCSAV